jgi:hypothetical protein
MPNYLVIRASEIPAVGQVMGVTISLENVPTSDAVTEQQTAAAQALQRMRDTSQAGVIGVVPAAQITRRTFTSPAPAYTVT